MLKQEIRTVKKTAVFNAHTFLSTIGKGRNMVSFPKKKMIFAQGDSRDGLFFVQSGEVQLSVVSENGREATLGILGEGDFFGEGGLAGTTTPVDETKVKAIPDHPKPAAKKKAKKAE